MADLAPFGESYYDVGDVPREQVIHDLLSRTRTPLEAADALAKQLIAGHSAYGCELSWDMIIAVASTLPDTNHIILVQLLVALATRGLDFDDNGQELEICMGVTRWDKLPNFRHAMFENWNSFNGPEEPCMVDGQLEHGLSLEQSIILWTRLNNFAILLTQTGLQILDFMLYGLWSMRFALETPLEGKQITAVQWWVPGAATWIFTHGAAVYDCKEMYGPKEDGTHSGAGGRLWAGKSGFCTERWVFWRTQFGQIACHSAIDEQTRDVARRAKLKMHEIEAMDCSNSF